MGQSTNQWILDAHLASATDFTGVDDIITNLTKEREAVLCV